MITLLVINSLVCLGFWNACLYETKQVYNNNSSKWETEETKGVLWFIEKWAKGKWFYKPLCGCLPCMASFHSTYVYWAYIYIIGYISLNALLFYPIYILALSGLNYIVNEVI